jgi:hypothetical protein
LRFEKKEYDIEESIFIFNGLSRNKELPNYVAFKSIDDGKYLFVNDADNIKWKWFAVPYYYYNPKEDFIKLMGNTFMYYSEEPSISDDGVFCAVTTLDDGTVRIKSRKTGLFWMGDSNDYIVPTTYATGEFKVITGDSFIALQYTGNQRYCGRYGYRLGEMQLDFLKADMNSIANNTKLVLEEPLFRREISDVKFHLEHARIHSNSLVSLDTDSRINNTADVLTREFIFTKKIEVVGTWETIVSYTTIDEKHFSASLDYIGIPVTLGGEVTLSTEAASSKRLAEYKGSSEERIITQDYTIPPGKKITAEFVAMEASYDVPYSYKRKDIFLNGETVYTLYSVQRWHQHWCQSE